MDPVQLLGSRLRILNVQRHPGGLQLGALADQPLRSYRRCAVLHLRDTATGREPYFARFVQMSTLKCPVCAELVSFARRDTQAECAVEAFSLARDSVETHPSGEGGSDQDGAVPRSSTATISCQRLLVHRPSRPARSRPVATWADGSCLAVFWSPEELHTFRWADLGAADCAAERSSACARVLASPQHRVVLLGLGRTLRALVALPCGALLATADAELLLNAASPSLTSSGVP